MSETDQKSGGEVLKMMRKLLEWVQTASLETKVLVRDTVHLLLCFGLAHSKQLRQSLEENVMLIVVFAMVFTLRPLAATSVGYSVDYVLWYLVFGALAPAVGLLAVVAFPNSSALFILTFFVLALGAGTMGAYSSRTKLPCGMFAVNLGTLFSVSYFYLNFVSPPIDSKSVLWEKIRWESASLLAGYLIPLGVHLFTSLVIFPWSSHQTCMEKVESTWLSMEALLSEATSLFSAVARQYSSFPESSCESWDMSEFNTEPLLGKINTCTKAFKSVQGHLFSARLETRFLVNGAGSEFVANYAATKPLEVLLGQLGENLVQQVERLHLSPVERLWHHSETTVGLEERNEMKTAFQNLALSLEELSVCTKTTLQIASKVLSKPLVSQDPKTELPWQALETRCAEIDTLYAKVMNDGKEWNRVSQSEASATVFVALHMKLIISMAKTLQDACRRKDAWWRSGVADSWEHRMSDVRVTLGRISTSTFRCPPIGAVVDRKQSKLRWHQWVYRDMTASLTCVEFHTGLKIAVCATLILILSFLPNLQAVFFMVSLSNALSTGLSALRQIQFGLVLERAILRCAGIFCGYVFAAVSFEMSCAIEAETCTILGGYFSFLVGLPLFSLYYVCRLKYTRLFYFSYSVLKEYYGITALVVAIGENRGNQVSTPYIVILPNETLATVAWRVGGYVAVGAFAGGLIAVLVGVLLLPTSGSGSLRQLLAEAFQHFIFLIEANLRKSYLSRTLFDPSLAVQADLQKIEQRLDDVEMYLWEVLDVQAQAFLAAAKLEPVQVRHNATVQETTDALEATRAIFLQLWTFRRLIKDLVSHRKFPVDAQQTISFSYLQIEYTKMLAGTFFEMSAALSGSAYLYATPPSLRHVASNPLLAKKQLDYFCRTIVRDGEGSLASQVPMAPFFKGDLVVLAHFYYSISVNLAIVINYTEKFMPSPAYCAELQEIDAAVSQAFFANKLSNNIERQD